ncbi:MAG: transcription termination factor Rho [Chthoniobacter sp.]|jgi:transcription termination factor Rho|nr:transcription termination factor Rho [Chthoniobacter sp.]
MTESTQESLLEEKPGPATPPPKRKASTKKGKATTTKAAKPRAKTVAAKKAPAKKVAKAKVPKADDELPLADTAPAAPKASIAAAPTPIAPPAAPPAAEEWRPSSARSEAAPAPAPTPVAVKPDPAPAAFPAPAAAPVADQPAFRPRPVYIPRHVAKQMEEQARLSGDPNPVVPIALPASEAPPRVEAPPPIEELGEAEGIVEVSGKGFGFLRDPKRGFAQHPNDVFVTPEICRSYGLRDGQWVKGETRRGNRGAQLYRLTEINGDSPQNSTTLPAFDELTVVSPMERIVLETIPDRYTTRVIDLMTPIGKGQRGLIVAPPRTGKTTLLQHIADAVVKNHPDIKLIILLVDERPEEVTEIKRTVPNAELMASSNDSDVKSHTRIAQLAIERAKRLVESGKDVFVLLDSITRVGRAFNNAMGGGGRTMSGGIDARALEIPRKLFAAARNTEEAGSLTIVATALIDTGSRMDELIFQEFKGTGNMELVLDRKISDQRIYPAVDIFLSGTRREELLIPADDLHKINVIRRGLAGHKPMEAMERLLFFLRKFPTNAQMLREIPG